MLKTICAFIAILLAAGTYAQVPQGIKYQAVARDGAGVLMANENINVRISILDSANGGAVVYGENHKTNTNEFGLFSIELGRGITPTGSFANIPWATGNKWLQIEMDPQGGTNFSLLGTSELIAVPYALFSGASANSGDTDDQTLSLNGTTLSIQDGNSVNLISLLGASWNIVGNSGTNPATHFIGTTDSMPLKFRINNEGAGMMELVYQNTFLGHQAGVATTTGMGNTAVGKSSFATNTEGYYNTAAGIYSMTSNTLGHNNVAIGVSSMYRNTTGSDNTALGYQALFENLGGNNNTAVGTFALVRNTTFNNSALGHQAMRENLTGANNTACGVNALMNNLSADYNAAVGVEALFYNTTGHSNTAVGGTAMYGNRTGYQNTAVGYSALDSNFAGNLNTAIGFHANVGADSLTNATAIGANAVVSSSNSLVLGNNANVGIGVNSPARSLHVRDVMRLEPRDTAPANPAEGDIYMDSSTHKLMVYDGTVWQACW